VTYRCPVHGERAVWGCDGCILAVNATKTTDALRDATAHVYRDPSRANRDALGEARQAADTAQAALDNWGKARAGEETKP